jgi:putative addiction module killer protein
MQYIVQQTDAFKEWHKGLRDTKARIAIIRRIERVEAGNFGDRKSVGAGISEMRIDIGAGYRLYYTMRERVVVFLLVGGDKSTQAQDIARAIQMGKEI